VRAVAVLLRTQVRQHWKSWLVLAALVALAGGFVMAAASTARRTIAAFPEFVSRHGYDAIIYSAHQLPALAGIPQVAQVTPALGPANFNPGCDSCTKRIDSGSFGIFEIPPSGLSRVVKLLSGRVPDQSRPGEVLASYTLARDNGVRIGSVITVRTPTKAQVQIGPGKVRIADVPTQSLRVVGFVVTENEFPTGIGGRYDLFTTPAYAAAVNPHTLVLQSYYVRLKRRAADLPAFEAHLRPLHSLGTDDLDIDAAAVQRGISPQAAGWWALAALAGLAGLAVIGQAAARQFVTDADDRQALSALGLSGRQFVALGLLRAAIIGGLGAAGAVALAALLSPLTPVGEARLAAESPGAVVVDPFIAVIGAAGTLVTVVALSAWPAVRNARARRGAPAPRLYPLAVVRAVAWTGAPPAALIGIRNALERGRGREPVPVGTALLGSVLALAALCGTAVFGASLNTLVSSPALYGAPFQAQFTNEGLGTGGAIRNLLLPRLLQDSQITQITRATVAEFKVNGRHVRAVAIKAVRGRALISTVDGHLPHGDRQIVLGASTMRSVGAITGGVVAVTVPDPLTGAARTEKFRVTGRATLPGSLGTGGLGTGAAVTLAGLARAQCPAGPGRSDCAAKGAQGAFYALLVRSAPGPAGAAALARYTSKSGKYRQFVADQDEPVELVNFGQSVNFPLLFGVLLALFGAATMVHLLLVSVARRRTEAGLLKVFGFLRRQVAAVVGWQATAVALVGIVAGVPLGIAVGKVAWRVSPRTSASCPFPWCGRRSSPRWSRECSRPRTSSPCCRPCWPRGHARLSCSGPSESWAGRRAPAGRCSARWRATGRWCASSADTRCSCSPSTRCGSPCWSTPTLMAARPSLGWWHWRSSCPRRRSPR